MSIPANFDMRVRAAKMMFRNSTDCRVYDQGNDTYALQHFPGNVHTTGFDFYRIVSPQQLIDYAVQYLQTGTISKQEDK